MGHVEHKHDAPKKVKTAVITVSDTRTEVQDASGKAIVELLSDAGHEPVYIGVVEDDIDLIQRKLKEAYETEGVQAIVVNGGTGVAKRDVTIEAIGPFMDPIMPGFGEIFRLLSYEEIGSAAMISRALAGVIEGKPIFCIPGSEKACRLAVSKLIAPELGHLVLEVTK